MSKMTNYYATRTMSEVSTDINLAGKRVTYSETYKGHLIELEALPDGSFLYWLDYNPASKYSRGPFFKSKEEVLKIARSRIDELTRTED